MDARQWRRREGRLRRGGRPPGHAHLDYPARLWTAGALIRVGPSLDVVPRRVINEVYEVKPRASVRECLIVSPMDHQHGHCAVRRAAAAATVRAHTRDAADQLRAAVCDVARGARRIEKVERELAPVAPPRQVDARGVDLLVHSWGHLYEP